jgi:hypothetical protein
MKSLEENAEAIVEALRRAEAGLTDELRLSTGLFGIRRQLQAHIGQHQRAGARIPIRKKFRIDCEKCGIEQSGEEEYYLHLRKVHGVEEDETVDLSNAPRTKYDGDIQELRRLLAEYTDSDTEDDFTRDPVEN